MSHRPTWTPAEGKSDIRHHSQSYSSRQLPSHTKLKFRQPAQGGIQLANPGSSEERRRDLRAALEQRERTSATAKGKGVDADDDDDDDDADEGKKNANGAAVKSPLRIGHTDADEGNDDAGAGEKGKQVSRVDTDTGGVDARDDDDDDKEDDEDEDDDDDDDDDEAALLRELEKIKRERAEEKARMEQEQAAKEEDERENSIALGNPLLNLENAIKGGKAGVVTSGSGSATMSFGVKRRWDDDVIFKNQTLGNDGEERGFVNDLTRTEFHKKFLKRYLK
ncbi:unnamed protein product [Tilletia laevis]|uniref:Cwf15/Cwc15 cell cycle control protein n=2 Tax=Tilletia TaxID=13289 RepID=A0A177V518_9BASI|nr:hypothetical protein CF336_g7522 [Tilletia laevis]KAE8248007.1 hypothetical protein A4X03_0g6897 [Tilletia caries]CAD6913710.1 unnamed protein product [Tilletia controversa]KAE8187646.1 hypothetical protein CF335_g7113 [Tilletia laevis]CAD6885611.1 unnamed protein product [Tilletia caries]